jgi:hypothetical protein
MNGKDVGGRSYGPISGITTTVFDRRYWGKEQNFSQDNECLNQDWTQSIPSPRHNSPYWTRIPSLSKHHNHTQTHHIWWDFSGWVNSPTKRHQPAHHTTFTRDKHSCLQWDLNPQAQQAISHRTMTWTTWWLGSEKPGHTKYQSRVPPFWPQQSETKVLKHNFNQYRKWIKKVRPP